MKQVNGEVRLLIILTMLFVFALPVGFLVITTTFDEHDQDDILDTGGAVIEEDHNAEDELTEPAEDGDVAPATDNENGDTDSTSDEDSENTETDNQEDGASDETETNDAETSSETE